MQNFHDMSQERADAQRYALVLSRLLEALAPPNHGWVKLYQDPNSDVLGGVSDALDGIPTTTLRHLIVEKLQNLVSITQMGGNSNVHKCPIAHVVYEEVLQGNFPVSALELERMAQRVGAATVQDAISKFYQAWSADAFVLHGCGSVELQRLIAGGSLVSPVCKLLTWPLLRGVLRCFKKEEIRPSVDLILDMCSTAFGIRCDVIDVVLAVAMAQPSDSCRISLTEWPPEIDQTQDTHAALFAYRLASTHVEYREPDELRDDGFVFPAYTTSICNQIEAAYAFRHESFSFPAMAADLQEVQSKAAEDLTLPFLVGLVRTRRLFASRRPTPFPAGAHDRDGIHGSTGRWLWTWEKARLSHRKASAQTLVSPTPLSGEGTLPRSVPHPLSHDAPSVLAAAGARSQCFSAAGTAKPAMHPQVPHVDQSGRFKGFASVSAPASTSNTQDKVIEGRRLPSAGAPYASRTVSTMDTLSSLPHLEGDQYADEPETLAEIRSRVRALMPSQTEVRGVSLEIAGSEQGEEGEEGEKKPLPPDFSIAETRKYAASLTPWEAFAHCFYDDMVNGKPMYLSQLNNLYKLRSGGKELGYREIGYTRLGEFLAAIPGVVVKGKAKSMSMELLDREMFEDFVDQCRQSVRKRLAAAQQAGLDTSELDVQFAQQRQVPKKILDRTWLIFSSLNGQEITAAGFLQLYNELYSPDKLRVKCYQDIRGFMARIPFIVNLGKRRSGKYALREGATWTLSLGQNLNRNHRSNAGHSRGQGSSSYHQ